MNQIASESVLEILLWPTIILVQSLLTLAPPYFKILSYVPTV